ncbi:hypothetical protein J1614_002543 [Plenodomus biglobosus]|nr:hypothetical protein J1614_002543 [Plenodomus biglobosus]
MQLRPQSALHTHNLDRLSRISSSIAGGTKSLFSIWFGIATGRRTDRSRTLREPHIAQPNTNGGENSSVLHSLCSSQSLSGSFRALASLCLYRNVQVAKFQIPGRAMQASPNDLPGVCYALPCGPVAAVSVRAIPRLPWTQTPSALGRTTTYDA